MNGVGPQVHDETHDDDDDVPTVHADELDRDGDAPTKVGPDDPDRRRGLGPLGHAMIGNQQYARGGWIPPRVQPDPVATVLARVRAVRDQWADRDAEEGSILELWEDLDHALADDAEPTPAAEPTRLDVLRSAEDNGDEIIKLTGPRSVSSPGGDHR